MTENLPLRRQMQHLALKEIDSALSNDATDSDLVKILRTHAFALLKEEIFSLSLPYQRGSVEMKRILRLCRTYSNWLPFTYKEAERQSTSPGLTERQKILASGAAIKAPPLPAETASGSRPKRTKALAKRRRRTTPAARRTSQGETLHV